MALRIRFQYPTAATLAFSVERLADLKLYDFSDATFKASPVLPTATLPEGTGIHAGQYASQIASTPIAQWTDGDYVVTVHDAASGFLVVNNLGVAMIAGSDGSNVRQLDMAQAVTDIRTTTVGGALNGSWSTAWGRAVKDVTNKILKVWGAGNATDTPSTTFQLDSGNNPTYRTPSG